MNKLNKFVISIDSYNEILLQIKNDTMYNEIIENDSELRAVEEFFTKLVISMITNIQPIDIKCKAFETTGSIREFRIQIKKQDADKLREKFIGFDLDMYVKRKLFECQGALI